MCRRDGPCNHGHDAATLLHFRHRCGRPSGAGRGSRLEPVPTPLGEIIELRSTHASATIATLAAALAGLEVHGRELAERTPPTRIPSHGHGIVLALLLLVVLMPSNDDKKDSTDVAAGSNTSNNGGLVVGNLTTDTTLAGGDLGGTATTLPGSESGRSGSGRSCAPGR